MSTTHEMGRARASFGFILGGLTLGIGGGIRALDAFVTPAANLELPLVWAAGLLGLAALLAGWLVQPRVERVLDWGLFPVAAAGAVFLLGWSLFDADVRASFLPAGVEAAGGFLLILSALRFIRAQARLDVELAEPPSDKEKVKLITEGQDKQPEVPLASLVKGDRLLVRAGEDVVVDGIIESGSGFVDERPVTAATLPAAKKAGDLVLAGSTSSVSEMVLETTALPEKTLLARRERLAGRLRDEALSSSKATLVGAALTLSWVVAGGFLSMQLEVPTWTQGIGVAVALLLAVVPAAPAVALLRSRMAVLVRLRKAGLIMGRLKDLVRLMGMRRWQIDPRLVASPGEVETVAFADVPPDVLLVAAQALLSEADNPERLSVDAAVEKRRLEALAPAALRKNDGVYVATINGNRWFMGPVGAVKEARSVTLDASMTSPVQFLRDKGMSTFIIGQDDEGVLGAVGMGFAADPDASLVAQSLSATLMPGLPDSTRQALALAAGIEADGPPAGKSDVTVLAEHSPPPSDGLRIRVLEVEKGLKLPSESAPRMFRPGLVALPPTFRGVSPIVKTGLRRAALVGIVPGAVACACLALGILSPGVGALIGLAGLVFSGRRVPQSEVEPVSAQTVQVASA